MFLIRSSWVLFVYICMDGVGVVVVVGVVIGYFLEEEGGRGFCFWMCWILGFKLVIILFLFCLELGLLVGRRDGYWS